MISEGISTTQHQQSIVTQGGATAAEVAVAIHAQAFPQTVPPSAPQVSNQERKPGEKVTLAAELLGIAAALARVLGDRRLTGHSVIMIQMAFARVHQSTVEADDATPEDMAELHRILGKTHGAAALREAAQLGGAE